MAAVATRELIRQSPARKKKRHRRDNRSSVYDTPDGFNLCSIPTCKHLVPTGQSSSAEVTCPAGHTVDLEIEGRLFDPSPGGFTHSGLTPTEQGRIAEEVIQELNDLGEFGRVGWWSDSYNCPLDGATDRGWGIEVKSVSTRARNLAFVPGGPRQKRIKDDYALERGMRGIVGALVVLDFSTSTAEISLHPMKRICYFAHHRQPFATGVPFANPLTAAASADIPF